MLSMSLNYLDLLKKSWEGFKENPVLILPLLISLFLFLGFVLVVGLELVVFIIVFSKEILSAPMLILKNPIGIFLLVFFGIADMVFIWMISSYIKAMQIGLYGEVTKNKKVTADDMFKYGKQLFRIYFEYQLAKFVIFVVPILIFVSITYLCYLASKILAIFVGVLMFLLLLGYFVFVGFGLFFIEPIIVTEKKSIIGLLKQSFNYSVKNFGHVIITWGITLVVAIGIALIMYIIKAPVSVVINVLKILGPGGPLLVLYGLSFLLEIVRGIVNVVLGIVLGLFVFNAYFAKSAKKKRK